MKKLIVLTTALVVFISANIRAQQTTPSQPNAASQNHVGKHHIKKEGKQKKHANHAIKQLNLTNAQTEQLKAQKQSYKTQMAAIKANTNVTVKEQNANIAALKATAKQQHLAILTTEQKTKLATIKATTKANKKAKQTARQTKRMDKLTKTLTLTPTQIADFTARKNATNKKADAIKANASLTKEEKKLQLKTLKADSKNDIKNVLNNEQLAKLETIKKDKKPKHLVK